APDPPAVAAGGRLAPEYAAAVAEVLNNPETVSRVVLDERFERHWPDDHAGVATPFEGGGFRLRSYAAPFTSVGAPLAQPLRDVVLERGGVGVFVSGNGTDVLLERFVVRALV